MQKVIRQGKYFLQYCTYAQAQDYVKDVIFLSPAFEVFSVCRISS